MDNKILGRRHPGPALTAAQECEYGKAKAGELEWVSPAIAAYVLGISTETLKKRRQRGEIPPHAVSRDAPVRLGARFRWAWVIEHAGHQRTVELTTEVAELRRETDRLAAEVRNQGALISELVDMLRKGGGARSLLLEREWSEDAQQRIIGLAEKVAGKTKRSLSWMDALAQPWANLAAMEPYALAADKLLDQLLLQLRESSDAYRDSERASPA